MAAPARYNSRYNAANPPKIPMAMVSDGTSGAVSPGGVSSLPDDPSSAGITAMAVGWASVGVVVGGTSVCVAVSDGGISGV